MAVFDDLPQELRQAIASSPLNHERSFELMLSLHRKGVATEKLVAAIALADRKKVAEHRARIDNS